jgi:hypothetical protein
MAEAENLQPIAGVHNYQEQSMKRIGLFATTMVVCIPTLVSIALAQKPAVKRGDIVKGKVYFLGQSSGLPPDQRVNKGGLVIVPFFENEKARKFHVDYDDKSFQRLGEVRGEDIKVSAVNSIYVGPVTWLLLRPIKEGQTQIIVTVTRGNRETKDTHNVTIAAE